MLIKFAIILLVARLIAADHCQKLLLELADKEAKFAYCVTKYSVPVSICVSCSDHYNNMKASYHALKNETICDTEYFDQDRVNLVSSTEAALSSLWKKGYCDDCTQDIFSAFENKSTELNVCLEEHKIEPCKACMIKYLSLNNFYTKLDEDNNGRVCFDIQDSMNRTRNNWSKDRKCCRREFKIILFTVALCIVSCLPILFYSGTYFVTKRQERNHGVLNDEDPSFNSVGPSSSNAAGHLYIRPIEPQLTMSQGISGQPTNNQSKGFSKLEDESDESDEENLATKID